MDNPIILIVLAMVFAAIVLTGQAVWFYIRAQREEEEAKIRHRLGLSASDEEEELASLLREQAADSALEKLGKKGEELQLTIQQAGMESTVSQLLTTMGVLAAITAVFGLLFVGPKALPLALIVGYLPLWNVKRKAVKRAKMLLSQLPDALEMMGRAMQTGAGLSDCFRLAQEEMSDPVSTEFGRVADAVRFGKEWRLALDEMIQRNPSLFDLRLFVSSILLQRETGGNMIETMHRISKLIRQRYAFDAKVKAMTSEARTTGLVLALMPLGVLILLLLANPAYLLPLWTESLGHIFIVYALGSYVFGLFIMTNMAKVEA